MAIAGLRGVTLDSAVWLIEFSSSSGNSNYGLRAPLYAAFQFDQGLPGHLGFAGRAVVLSDRGEHDRDWRRFGDLSGET